jgi:hypothetical protein
VYARPHFHGETFAMKTPETPPLHKRESGTLARMWLPAVAGMTMLALSACGGAPVKRVSEPSASIQQLTVRADGQWSVDLRLDNFSSVPMRFDNLSLTMTVGGESAGTLTGAPALSVGPESADIATLTLAPASAAKIVVADVLSGRRSVTYALQGAITATPDGGKPRTFDVVSGSALNPAPGLPGVLR